MHACRSTLEDPTVARGEGLHTISLQPLSVAAVGELVDGTDLDPERVHAVTAGNPFFVTAVAREPDMPMPASVRDAVLARIADVEPEDLEVLQLVATAPDGLDDRVLPALRVDLPTLRRVDATALLTRSEAGLSFRHELTRLAILSTVPPGGAPVLHARLLDGLEALQPRDPAVLTHHAVGARDAERALRHAREAYAEAVAASSNGEAAAFAATALDNLPASAPPAERAELMTQLARQQYLTGRLPEAVATYAASVPVWEAAGDTAGVASAYGALAIVEYLGGDRRSSDEHSAQACVIADASGDPATIAQVHADDAMLAVVASDMERTRASAARATRVATDAGIEQQVIAGSMVLEAPAAIGGDAAARTRVLDWTRAARRGGWDELAWRGYVLQFAADLEHSNLRGAQELVDEALTYVVDRDLPVAQHWHLSFRGIVHLSTGRWSAAREDGERVLAEGAMGAIWPDYVLGLVALRTGEGDATAPLDRMWSRAEGLDEPLRWLSALRALAEAMWMTGRTDPRVTGVVGTRFAALTATSDTRWSAGALALWLRRLGLPYEVPAAVTEAHRLVFDGRYEEASAWWRAVGDPFEEAMAFVDSPDPDHRTTAVALLDRAGAVATADRLRVELRRDGLTTVPQRPRESTRANPGGLTNRQLEVARLVARGRSNAEIAAELYISPKTTDHHVSAVLAKLGLPNRRAVAVNAAELGLD